MPLLDKRFVQLERLQCASADRAGFLPAGLNSNAVTGGKLQQASHVPPHTLPDRPTLPAYIQSSSSALEVFAACGTLIIELNWAGMQPPAHTESCSG